MKLFYNYLINFGVKPPHTNHYNKKVKLLNFVCVLWYHAFIFTSILTVLVRDNYEVLLTINILGLLFILSTHILNKKGKFVIAVFAMLLFTVFYFLLISSYVTTERFTEFFLILVPSCGLVFFEKKKYHWILFLISLIAFHIPFLYFDYYKSETIMFISTLMIFLFLLNFLIVSYFKELNSKNEILLEQERDRVLKDKIILEKQEQKLRELNEFKSHFFVNLSHEIRTPLTLIRGYTSQIETQDLNEGNKDRLSIITQQTNQMQSIIDSIMDLSKMDTNQFSIAIKPVNLTNFLIKIYTSFKPLFDKKNILFVFKDSQENLDINIDEDLFIKAINNLLSNALKFTSNNGSVKLQTKLVNDIFIITVEDNGIGIPENQINHVFKRFYQVKNDITQSQGSGIGLAFTKKILDLHGFSIQLTSEPDYRTTFSIHIPKIAMSTSSIKKSDFASKVIVTKELKLDKELNSNTKKTTKKKRILVVDDHEQMRTYIKTVLTPDYAIVEAEHGKHALDLIQKQSFDMIITDYMMPIMNGETLVKELQTKQIKTPVIVLTARTDNQGKLNMLRLGIDRYLNKPFLEEELLLSIKTSLSIKHNADDFKTQLTKHEIKAIDTYTEKFNIKLNTYIFENIKSPKFGIDSIAEHFKISKSTLNRKVKSLLGQTPKEVIMEARLQKARLLLDENPYETQKNIAEAVGITNSNYFFNKMEERFGKKRFSM